MSRIPNVRTVRGIPLARVTGIPVEPGGRAKWKPKYDWAVPGRELGKVQTTEEVIAAQGDDPWIMSPPSSHTEMFRLIDAGAVRRITAIGSDGQPIETIVGTRLGIIQARSGLGSTIWVRFKPQKNRPAYTYVFFLGQDHARARSIFEAMRSTDSPWTVGHQQLEKAGVPYKRVSGSYGEQ